MAVGGSYAILGAAVIAAIGAIIAAIISLHNRSIIQQIHVLVNSRLDQAISEIDDLKAERERHRGDHHAQDDDSHTD